MMYVVKLRAKLSCIELRLPTGRCCTGRTGDCARW